MSDHSNGISIILLLLTCEQLLLPFMDLMILFGLQHK